MTAPVPPYLQCLDDSRKKNNTLRLCQAILSRNEAEAIGIINGKNFQQFILLEDTVAKVIDISHLCLKEEQVITPLICLAASKNLAGVVQALIQSKQIDLDSKSTRGHSALHIAVHYGNTKIVEILLDSKANVDACDTTMQTPLMLAAQKRHKEIVEKILEKKADVNAKDNKENTALEKAITNLDDKIATPDLNEIIRILIECGTNPPPIEKIPNLRMQRTIATLYRLRQKHQEKEEQKENNHLKV